MSGLASLDRKENRRNCLNILRAVINMVIQIHLYYLMIACITRVINVSIHDKDAADEAELGLLRIFLLLLLNYNENNNGLPLAFSISLPSQTIAFPFTIVPKGKPFTS